MATPLPYWADSFTCRAKGNLGFTYKVRPINPRRCNPWYDMYASTLPVHLSSTAICQQPWKSPAIGTALVLNTTTTPHAPIASNVISRGIRVDGGVFSTAEKIDIDETAATGVVSRPTSRDRIQDGTTLAANAAIVGVDGVVDLRMRRCQFPLEGVLSQADLRT